MDQYYKSYKNSFKLYIIMNFVLNQIIVKYSYINKGNEFRRNIYVNIKKIH